MNQPANGRMLLSHNFDLSDAPFPELSREEFATVFSEGFRDYPTIRCRLLSHAHWVVEVLFPAADFAAAAVGELCANILVKKRSSQKPDDAAMPDILILAGNKATPATSSDPEALQTGEWGVDVVETASATQFLESLGWEAIASQKAPDSIFKVEIKG